MGNRTIVVKTNYTDGDTDGPFRVAKAGDILVDGDSNVILPSGQRGEIYVSSPAGTTITTALTYVVVAGTYTSGSLSDFSHGTNGRLQYDGDVTGLFQVTVAFSFSADTADTYHFRLAVNGVAQAKTQVNRQIGAGVVNVLGAAAVQGLLSIDPGQYVELWVTSATADGPIITVQTANIIAGI